MLEEQNALHEWVTKTLGMDLTYAPLAGDASFRRYYRLNTHAEPRILMVSPPQTEPLKPFLTVQTLLARQGLPVPHVYAVDETQGFALLTDLGDTLLLDVLNPDTVDSYYGAAIDLLVTLAACPTDDLPVFDVAHMHREMDLFIDWFLPAQSVVLDGADKAFLETIFNQLAQTIDALPRVFIHRDYHARNMLCLSQTPPQLALIDFQDAMRGPVSYDLVSLLKDCYIAWPREAVLTWVRYYFEQSPWLAQSGMTLPNFIKAFDYCGLQRHIKVLGIFSRLAIRDNKSRYLADIPLVLQYVMNCLDDYPEFAAFADWMRKRVSL